MTLEFLIRNQKLAPALTHIAAIVPIAPAPVTIGSDLAPVAPAQAPMAPTLTLMTPLVPIVPAPISPGLAALSPIAPTPAPRSTTTVIIMSPIHTKIAITNEY